MKERALITATQIAERAGVSHQAVYAWRRRFPDFPGQWISGYWEIKRIRKWMESHNKPFRG